MFEFMRGRPHATGSHRLGKTSLLAGLKGSELNIVEGFLHTRHYLPGEIVFDQDEDGQALYVVLSGRVLICRPGHADTPIAELGAGEFFGELALLDDSPRSAQARAGEPAELAVLFRGDFERLMESHAQIASRIAMQLARHIGQRLRNMVALVPHEVRSQ
ncbi:MAG: cyclic nucleotide-binding protein [Rhodocyclaceae bacterium]|nr:cyclic nucleotide-binding protein [Rhodocyclaceae bacterium]